MEVHPNVRDVKEKKFITSKIRDDVERILIAFVIKEELEKLEGIETMQKKVNTSGIPKLVQEYNIKYLNYLYYR